MGSAGAEWFPELVDTTLRQVSWPQIEPHRDYIVTQLEAAVTVATIHQRLRDERGLEASVASLRRWVRANLPEESRRQQVRVLRPDDVVPGSEGQVDYGKLGMWIDPQSGRRRAVWAFVLVLACSRHMFVRPVLTMDQREWTRAHVDAFAFFDGYAGVEPAFSESRRRGWASVLPRSARGLATEVGAPSRRRWPALGVAWACPS
ncbi:hypothetical protein ACFQV8_40250 [Pseudonocardia benzenivorans]